MRNIASGVAFGWCPGCGRRGGSLNGDSSRSQPLDIGDPSGERGRGRPRHICDGKVCPSVVGNGTIQTYAKIIDDSVAIRVGRARPAGDRLGAEYGVPRSAQSTLYQPIFCGSIFFRPSGRGPNCSCQETSDHSAEGSSENYPLHAEDAKGKGELRLGDADRNGSAEAGRE